MNHGFSRSHRIVSANDYKEIWQKARRLSGNCIALVNCKNHLAYARLGLSFSKKYFPNAVDRNRLKRVARETFRLYQNQLNSLDIIAVGYKGANLLSPKEQYHSFRELWLRLVTLMSRSS